MNNVLLNGFFDELAHIEKTAAPWGALGSVFRTGWRGLQNVGRGLSGTVTNRAGQAINLAGPKRQALALAGLKQLAPAAALAGGGLMAGYGAKKALFG